MKPLLAKKALIRASWILPTLIFVIFVITFVVIPHAQNGAHTETNLHYNKEGEVVKVETDYDDQGRIVEEREFYKNGKLRMRFKRTYPKGFKKPNTSKTEYGPDGTTPRSTTNEDFDKDGNPTSAVTTSYDAKGKEIGGHKRERDSKTGKDRCYKWIAEKQVYEEERCPETITDEELTEWKYGFHPPPKASENAKVETSNGIQRVSFALPQGRVVVNLPDDMMAGDTISGTVVAEPKGQTSEERTKNLTELNGYVIELETPKKSDGTSTPKVNAPISATPSPFTFKLPQVTTPTAPVTNDFRYLTVSRMTDLGLLAFGKATVPIDVISESSLRSLRPISVENRIYEVPTIGQQGRPIEIIGPFDGNIGNTRLMFGPAGSSIQDFEKNTENVTGGFGLLQPLAESPRKCVLTAPTNVTGPIELFVKDGQSQTTSPYRNVAVNLTAPKTNLLKGEHTELHVEVNGLQGITQPVPLTLTSNGVITMEGGMYQPLLIQPSQVGADGRYTTTRGITGVQTGGWTSTATVVTQPFNIILRDPVPPQTVLVNSFTGDYVFCGAGPKLTGAGQVKRQGCVFTLTDNKIDRQISGTFDGCAPVDNGRFWILYSAGAATDVKVTVTGTQPKQTRVYFNPLSRPAPPIQDVSAFATCP